MQEFTISTDNLDRLVILEDPFLALRLHIQVNNFVTSSLYEDICMGMAIYGCHHSEGTVAHFCSHYLKAVDALSIFILAFSYPGSTAQQLSLCDTRGHPSTAVSPVSGGEGLPGTGHCPPHSTDHHPDHSSYCSSGRGTLYQGESQREGAQVRMINLVPKLSDELE